MTHPTHPVRVVVDFWAAYRRSLSPLLLFLNLFERECMCVFAHMRALVGGAEGGGEGISGELHVEHRAQHRC